MAHLVLAVFKSERCDSSRSPYTWHHSSTLYPSFSLSVCSLSFEPTMSSKFMVGTAQGNVMSCRMQAKAGTSGLLVLLLLLLMMMLMLRVNPWGV